MTASNTRISNLISSQVPFYVRNDHPNFIRFLESYYEYLEQENKDLDTLKRMREYSDVDTTRVDFLDQFYNNFMRLFPDGTVVDKTLVLKHIKEFYQSRGSAKSVKFLLRILYNQEIEDIYLPKQDILRASDGKWYVEKALLLGDVQVDNVSNTMASTLNYFVANRVTGQTSNAYAIVEKASSYYNRDYLVSELSISNRYRNFVGAEKIYCFFEENGQRRFLSANLFSGFIDSVSVAYGGSGYSVGDQVTIESNTGSGGLVVVATVMTGNVKTIYPDVDPEFRGAGFQAGQYILFTGGSGGTGANARISKTLADSSIHPNSYVMIASVISDEVNTFIGNTSVVYETFAYQNLATQYIRSSNLTISTGTGNSVNVINLSARKANSNVFFETYDSLNVNGVIVLITSSNTIANTITVRPGLVGNLIANSFQVIKKANDNTTIANAGVSYVYANTGPMDQIQLLTHGDYYLTTPQTSVVANTRIRSLGILGRMKIVTGGTGYALGDTISFENVPFGYGSGGAANVTNVAANGMIRQVRFKPVTGQITGGSGYDMNFLPLARISSANGNGANIIVTTLLGRGESISTIMNKAGTMMTLGIVDPGSGYETAPTLNLTSIGDGTAQASATVINGEYNYPGRYLNDDGHLSGYNFLEDRDYYQNFSYVVKSRQSVDSYRQALNQLVHPSGMKLFAEYLYDNTGDNINVSVQSANGIYNEDTRSGKYVSTSNANGITIVVNADSNTINLVGLSNVYMEFISGDQANLSNGIYRANVINTTSFSVYRANVRTGTVRANSGNGNTFSLMGTGTNFKSDLAVGDVIKIGGWSNTFYVGVVSNASNLYVTDTLPPYITGNTYGRVYTPSNSSGTIYFTSI
jgi:hypothetical protein